MISIQQSNHLKSIAILMMICLHLFNTLDYEGLFEPLLYIGSKPLIYYISLFCDACVPIFAFVSGYGLYFKFQQNQSAYWTDNLKRLKKLYLNYWIIVFLFPVTLGLLLHKEGYPGSMFTLIENLLAINISYNGAWWFFTIYVLFVLTSSFWFKLLDRTNPYCYLLVFLCLYFISFYIRVYKSSNYSVPIFNRFHTQAALYGCTLFQFMLGAFAFRFNWNIICVNFLKSIQNKAVLFVFGTILLLIGHGLVTNFIIAPFTALVFFVFIYTN